MIVGIGTDIVEIDRVGEAYARAGFAERVFTGKERELIGTRMARAAGNFAVKEAVVKAFGTGFGAVQPCQIEVLREPSGRPYVILHGQAQQQAEQLGIGRLHVSISDEKAYATAYVVAEE